MRNQSLATVAKSILVPLLLSAGLLAAFSASASDPVYKWKDAQGHDHYAQSPPEGVKYQTITPSGAIAASDVPLTAEPTAEPAKDAAASKSDDTGNAAQTPAQIQRQKLCSSAQANVTTLNNNATVTADINGDGKPVTLNAKQHDQELSDAKKQADLYCSN